MLRREFLALVPASLMPATLVPWELKKPQPDFLTDEQIAQKIVDYHNNIIIGASPHYFTYSDYLPSEPSHPHPHAVERHQRIATSNSLSTVTKTRNGTQITETHTFRDKKLRDRYRCSWNEWFDIKDPAVKILQFIDPRRRRPGARAFRATGSQKLINLAKNVKINSTPEPNQITGSNCDTNTHHSIHQTKRNSQTSHHRYARSSQTPMG